MHRTGATMHRFLGTHFAIRVFLAVVCFMAQPLHAGTWTNASVPKRWWTSVAFSPDASALYATSAAYQDIFSRTSGGGFVLTNGSSAWRPLSLPDGLWSTIASSADGSTLYAANGYLRLEGGSGLQSTGNLFSSGDGGMTWTSNSFPHGDWISVACSSNGSTVVLSDQSGQSLVSYDFGATFPKVWNFGAAHAALSYDGSVILIAGSSLQLSTDGGVSFVNTGQSDAWTGVAASADGSRLYAVGGSRGLIFSSTNTGASWQSVRVASSSSGAYFSSVACSADGSIVLAGCGLEGYGRFLSTNAGATWIGDLANGLWTVDAVAVSSDGSHLAIAGGFSEDIPVFQVSTNFGATWNSPVWPYSTWSVLAASADGSTIAASGLRPPSSKLITVTTFPDALYLSKNGGSSWITNATLPAMCINAIASSADGTKWITAGARMPNGTFPGVAGSVYTSTNSGATWTSNRLAARFWNAAVSSADGSKLAVSSGNLIFNGTLYPEHTALFTSPDGGTTWISNVVAVATGTSFTALAASADGSQLFAATARSTSGYGSIFRSTNFGTNWTPTAAPTNDWQGLACSADGMRLAASGLQTNRVFLSVDAGSNWTSVLLPGASILGKLAMSASGLNIVAPAAPIPFTSDDGGATWSAAPGSGAWWTAAAISADGARRFACAVSTNEGGLPSIGQIHVLDSAPQPVLSLSSSTVSWNLPSRPFALQQNPDLDPAHWTPSPLSCTVTNLQIQATLPPGAGNLFFRLVGQ